MQHSLRHPYISVQKDSAASYGGSQRWSARPDMRKCGCGVIAMMDLVVYLTRYHGLNGPAEVLARAPIPQAVYDRISCGLQRKYLPMVPPFGINGLTLAAGIGAYFRLHGMGLRARWGVGKKRFWQAMAEMLDRDLPVIFSVGPNLPLVWQNHKLRFYRKTPDGTYAAVTATKAHYVTATGLDETWIRIASWGKEYYIHRGEYEAYGRQHSSVVVHNLVWLHGTSDAICRNSQ